jgi:hypothetical protein
MHHGHLQRTVAVAPGLVVVRRVPFFWCACVSSGARAFQPANNFLASNKRFVQAHHAQAAMNSVAISVLPKRCYCKPESFRSGNAGTSGQNVTKIEP